MFDASPERHNHIHLQNRFAVIPTGDRLWADHRLCGRGVRIAFLDSGFYPHPDFRSRVVEFHDIAGEDRYFDAIVSPAGHHWHGTQTVAACAGDGTLSDGVYRGLASQAELVLVKASRRGRIGDQEIEAGLRWIIANRERLSLRILNISLGGDCDLPTSASLINQLVEELVASGVVVVVAAGNSAERRSAPPASALSAITVGGYTDENQFDVESYDLYHSSHGETADGSVKPELLAPAMFVAAPILPGTPEYERAELLSLLAGTPDYALPSMLAEYAVAAGLPADVGRMTPEAAREAIDGQVAKHKLIANHYQHVDGTSFASPITASVAALMLEANPRLAPAAVKDILISTASRLAGRPALRQGFGMINADLAVSAAAAERHDLVGPSYHAPCIERGHIIFKFHHDTADQVAVVGDFNRWDQRQARSSSPRPVFGMPRYPACLLAIITTSCS